MSVDLLKEISHWKLEAKLEDSDRYFYHTDDVESIDVGEKCYITGRKGTGKTAVAEFLRRRTGATHFAEKLSFKNFPFNDLYEYSDSGFASPNQYITLWKWIIYCYIAKLMIRNENIDVKLRTQLADIFPDDPVRTLSRSISHLTSPELRVSFLGLEVAATARRVDDRSKTSWMGRCELLQEIIATHIDDCVYTIVFDELDEDYHTVARRDVASQYSDLLTSLFKAVQDIVSLFPPSKFGIRPVIFLRTDIYDFLKDPDKTKWSDLRTELRWDPDAIRRLLAFRISRAQNETADPLPFSTALNAVFDTSQQVKEAKNRPLVEWIGSYTLSRPRDYISFMRIAAADALRRGEHKIGAASLKHTLELYSDYLRSDLQDELGTVMPEIHDVLNVIARIGKSEFRFREFGAIYNSTKNASTPLTRSADQVLSLLFRFGLIGNRTADQRSVSGIQSGALEFNPDGNILILRGLLRALRIPDHHGRSLSGGQR